MSWIKKGFIELVILVTFCVSASYADEGDLEYECDVSPESGIDAQAIEGKIILTQPASGGDTTIEVSLSGFDTSSTEKRHGFHIHTEGNLGDNCLAAGGHYNPAGVTHGAPDAEVRHVGDLGNIEVNDQGEVSVTLTDSLVSLQGESSVAGRSFVIHEGVDDLGLGGTEGSLTTGNAGARLACCIIEPMDTDEPTDASVTHTIKLYVIVVAMATYWIII